MTTESTVDELIAAEVDRHRVMMEGLQRLRAEIRAAEPADHVAASRWVGYADLARLWGTSLEATRKKINRATKTHSIERRWPMAPARFALADLVEAGLVRGSSVLRSRPACPGEPRAALAHDPGKSVSGFIMSLLRPGQSDSVPHPDSVPSMNVGVESSVAFSPMTPADVPPLPPLRPHEIGLIGQVSEFLKISAAVARHSRALADYKRKDQR